MEKDAKNREINRLSSAKISCSIKKRMNERNHFRAAVCTLNLSILYFKFWTEKNHRRVLSLKKIDHMAELLKTGEAVYLNIQQRGVFKHREREDTSSSLTAYLENAQQHTDDGTSWTSVSAKPRRMNFSWICSWRTAKVYTLRGFLMVARPWRINLPKTHHTSSERV